jgi:hypothetical protein
MQELACVSAVNLLHANINTAKNNVEMISLVSKQVKYSEISGSLGGEYEAGCLLGCCAV